MYDWSKLMIDFVTGYKIKRESNAVAIKPLYKAPIIFFFCPVLTNHVPAIDVRIHEPPIAKG